MKTTLRKSSPPVCIAPRDGRAAFSLIEIMVAVGLLTFIILGLLAMFMQTQKAFRSSMTQTDVLEAGRSVMEMLTREVEQAYPTRYPQTMYNGRRIQSTNFFIHVPNLTDPFVQDLPGTAAVPARRTNYLERFFFFTKIDQDWIGTGYVVIPADPLGWAGTLYRFQMTNQFRNGPFYGPSQQFWLYPPLTNMSRIADGVVHLRVRPFTAAGFPIVSDGFRNTAFARTNAVLPGPGAGLLQYGSVRQAFVWPDPRGPDQMSACYFLENALPAQIEVEFGILEPQLYQRYKSIPEAADAARRQYLANRSAQIHIFRQRIPLRNVDTSIFP